jgi:hypothetical protein
VSFVTFVCGHNRARIIIKQPRWNKRGDPLRVINTHLADVDHDKLTLIFGCEMRANVALVKLIAMVCELFFAVE